MLETIPTIVETQPVREAARMLIADKGDMLAVVSAHGDLTGVVTDWNITEAAATGYSDNAPVTDIMTREVITARPTDSILDVVRKLEHYEISAMPVVTEKGVSRRHQQRHPGAAHTLSALAGTEPALACTIVHSTWFFRRH